MTLQVLQPTLEHLRQCAAALRAGQLVAMPTETVYGLAGRALDPAALARIFAAKERPTFDPLIVHVLIEPGPRLPQLVGLVDLTQLSPLAGARVEALTDAFWPGPLTLVLPKLPVVPDLATAGLATVAVRAPLHPIARALLHELGEPLAAPSANRFGRISPTTVDDVASELADRIDWALDGGPCSVGVESTVVAVANDGRLTLLRPGGVPAAELAAVVGLELGRTQASEGAQVAPGMLASHYAPRTPVVLLPAAVSGRVAVLGWQRLPQLHGAEVIAGDVLSAVGDPAEAARRLFRALRTLDASGAEVIAVELPPTEEGLCHAIRDRLQRAAAPR